MKKSILFLLLLGIFMAAGKSTFSQGMAGWRMLLNGDHSAFTIHIYNEEMTFYFNPKSDTLTFSPSNNKPIKDYVTIEVSLKNSKKVIYTSTEKNVSSDKSKIVVAVADIVKATSTQKLPKKPKYQIAVMEKTNVKEKIYFEFKE